MVNQMVGPEMGAMGIDPAFTDPISPGQGDVIARDAPNPSTQRLALVDDWTRRVTAAKAFFAPSFRQMREDMDFARGKQWVEDGKYVAGNNKYVANIALRHVQQKVSGLYARNPKVSARVKPRLMSSVWDGTTTSVIQALQLSQQDPTNAQALQIMTEYNAAVERTKMMDAVSRTLELVYDQNISEQEINFKVGVKGVVRRAVTTGIGYAKVGFQRVMKLSPEVERRISDYSERLATVERLSADLADDEVDKDSAEAEQLRLSIMQLKNEEEIIAKEGLAISYPASTAIIPDPKVQQIRGFIGADWVAEEFILTPDQIKEIYKVDVGSSYRGYANDHGALRGTITTSVNSAQTALFGTKEGERGKSVAVVWEIYSRKDGLVYVVCDGYTDFLLPPAAPDVWMERFWPWFVLTLNDVEHYEDVFPPSDVRLITDMQREINRARQGLREHRVANRPKTAVAAGLLDDEDVEKLKSHPANAVLELTGLQPGQKIEDLLQPIKMPGIDPNLYDVSPSFQDIERTVGVQEANLGGGAGGTATESSIAESSRMTQMASNIDDLNDFLTEIARAAGQILMTEVSQETAKRIAGPGAVWPQLSREQVAAELEMKIEAGSTGRPNQAVEIANMQKIMPLLLQIPGIQPEFIAKEMLRRLDDNLDLAKAFQQGLPSIMAQNSAPAAGAAGQPAEAGKGRAVDPGAQGAEGGNKVARPENPEDPTAVPGPKLRDYVQQAPV